MADVNEPTDDFDQQRVAEVTAMLRLSMIPGVGPIVRRNLLQRFGSATTILSAMPSDLREVAGVGNVIVNAIFHANEKIDADAELARCKQHGITIVPDFDEAYPRALKEIYDPPGILFCQGKLIPQDALSVAIVGTRHASLYGKKQAARLSASLARAGLTIVSGLARGIDAAAHQAALDAGGRTIAVLANGLADIYPPEHRELAQQIADQGAVVSENPTTTRPRKGNFPRRNRIITGMSWGVIVVEAALSSGALISADHATEQGREVFAVPGSVESRASRGCHRLIRDGAKLVETADDVLEELGPLVEAAPSVEGHTVRRPAELQLNDQERKVLDVIQTDPTSIDEVINVSGLPAHRVLSTISVLEMRRLVRRVSGSTVVRP